MQIAKTHNALVNSLISLTEQQNHYTVYYPLSRYKKDKNYINQLMRNQYA